MQTNLFINGTWVAPVAGGTLPVIDPASEAVVHHIPAATAPDADKAVQAARMAFDQGPWPCLSGAERAKVLRAIAQGIRDRLPELARLEVIDNGKPLPEAEWDLGDAAGCFDVYAGLAEELDHEMEHVALPDARFMSKVVREVKNISLELGGKSPLVVFADSNIEKAVEWIMFGIFWNQGQVCSATSRVLVERSLYAPLLARLVIEAQRITIGNGLEPGTLLGTLVKEGQYRKVLGFIDRAVAAGARLATGGKAAHAKGYFVAPTILTEVALDAEAWIEEVFGPVVCSAPSRPKKRRSVWPTTPASALRRRSCPATTPAPNGWRRPSAPGSSGSTVPSPPSPKRPGVTTSNPASGANSAGGALITILKPSRSPNWSATSLGAGI
jgi:acyl-CoA reductase-like NAD-dependent aldehyde dehydrogenase